VATNEEPKQMTLQNFVSSKNSSKAQVSLVSQGTSGKRKKKKMNFDSDEESSGD
jgi:hypothetical protein